MLPSPRSDDCPGLPLIGAGGHAEVGAELLLSARPRTPGSRLAPGTLVAAGAVGARLAGNATLGARSLIGPGRW